jgi:hypothetical protein
VTSTTDFYVGALPPVLVIDGKAFARSKSPPDGRLNTLIFTIDAADFDALPESGAVSVGYLHPGARLTPGRPAGAGLTANGAPAAGSAPVVRPDQVGPNRRSIGNLHKSLMEVRP